MLAAAGPVEPESSGQDRSEVSVVIRVIVVGRRNIRASVLAEMILRDDLEPFEVQVTSAGVDAVEGEPMDVVAMRLAEHYGIEPDVREAHSSRMLAGADLAVADLVLTLTRSQRDALADVAPNGASAAFTLREFERLARSVASADADARASAGGRDAASRMQHLAAMLRERRSSDPAAGEDDLEDASDDSAENYERMWVRLLPAVAEVSRLLEIAADVR